MTRQLKIRVTCSDDVRVGSFKELYRNTIAVDTSVQFEYQKVIDVLLLLYANKNPIIEFSLF